MFEPINVMRVPNFTTNTHDQRIANPVYVQYYIIDTNVRISPFRKHVVDYYDSDLLLLLYLDFVIKPNNTDDPVRCSTHLQSASDLCAYDKKWALSVQERIYIGCSFYFGFTRLNVYFHNHTITPQSSAL